MGDDDNDILYRVSTTTTDTYGEYEVCIDKAINGFVVELGGKPGKYVFPSLETLQAFLVDLWSPKQETK